MTSPNPQDKPPSLGGDPLDSLPPQARKALKGQPAEVIRKVAERYSACSPAGKRNLIEFFEGDGLLGLLEAREEFLRRIHAQ